MADRYGTVKFLLQLGLNARPVLIYIGAKHSHHGYPCKYENSQGDNDEAEFHSYHFDAQVRENNRKQERDSLMSNFSIGIIPGDGIGREVTPIAFEVASRAASQ